jgi:GNAT superfamily N-acetyltransferase
MGSVSPTQIFSVYEPDLSGVPAEVVVDELVAADLSACAGLLAARAGGEIEAFEQLLARKLNDPRHVGFIARIDGEMVGFAACTWLEFDPEPPSGWYLTDLGINPSARRRGAGRALTRARLDWLAAMGEPAWCFINSRNQSSVDLHLELGFQLVDDDIRVPGVEFTDGKGLLFQIST